MNLDKLKEIKSKLNDLHSGIGDIPSAQVDDVPKVVDGLEKECATVVDMVDELIDDAE